MFKEAFNTAIQLTFNPQFAWKQLKERGRNDYWNFLIPMWILVLGASLIGGWFLTKNGSFELGLKNCIADAFILIGSFYISAFFINEYTDKLTDVEKQPKDAQAFVAYSSALFYLIYIIVSLFSDFFFLWLFSLYTVQIVYTGGRVYFNITAERRSNFMFIASLIILGVPLIVKSCLSMMMS